MKKEIWRMIPGYEGLYEVSNFGRVRSFLRGKIRKLSNENGYMRIILYKNGSIKKFNVHRLVAMAFIPNPDNLPCINHKDENKSNNHVDNLEWCDYTYNNNYGNRIEKAREKQLNGKLSKSILQLDLEGNIIKEWESSKEIERQLGYSRGTIGSCCRGKPVKDKNGYYYIPETYKGFKWRFKEKVE